MPFRRTQANFGDILHNEPMEYLRSYLHDTGFVPSVVLLFVFCALLRGVRDSMWRIAVGRSWRLGSGSFGARSLLLYVVIGALVWWAYAHT